MVELHWTPEQIGQLTIPQLICLTNEKPPARQQQLEEHEQMPRANPVTGRVEKADVERWGKVMAEHQAKLDEAWRL